MKDIGLKNLHDVEDMTLERVSLGQQELDGFFGGGMVKGSVTIIAGQPGVGKSTLAVQIGKWLTEKAGVVYYVSGEMDAKFFKATIATRVGMNGSGVNFYLDDQSKSIEDIIKRVSELTRKHKKKPAMVVIDSVNKLVSPYMTPKDREVLEKTTKFFHKHHIPLVLISQIDKGGRIKGLMELQHEVDVLVLMELDKTLNQVVMRASKNRLGPTDHTVCMLHVKDGLRIIPRTAETQERVI